MWYTAMQRQVVAVYIGVKNMRVRLAKQLKQFVDGGWHLVKVVVIDDDKHSANYIFEQSGERRIIYTENNTIKK